MRYYQYLPTILLFSIAHSIMALPMLEDKLLETMAQEQTIDPLRNVSHQWWLHFNPFLKISSNEPTTTSEPNLPQTEGDSKEPVKTDTSNNIQDLHDPRKQEVPSQDFTLQEMLKYYIAIVESDNKMFTHINSSTRHNGKSTDTVEHDSAIIIPNFTDDLDDLLKIYAISMDSLTTVRNIFGDITALAINESGELINLESKLNPILFDQFAVIDTSLSVVPQNTLAGLSQDRAAVKVLTFKELMIKIINIILHPVSIIIFLVFIFFIAYSEKLTGGLRNS